MGGRLFGPTDESRGLDPEVVPMVAIAVYDRGPGVDRGARYEAQLAGYSVVHARGAGASLWQEGVGWSAGTGPCSSDGGHEERAYERGSIVSPRPGFGEL